MTDNKKHFTSKAIDKKAVSFTLYANGNLGVRIGNESVTLDPEQIARLSMWINERPRT